MLSMLKITSQLCKELITFFWLKTYCSVNQASHLCTEASWDFSDTTYFRVSHNTEWSNLITYFSLWSICEGLCCRDDRMEGEFSTLSSTLSSLWTPSSLSWGSGSRFWGEGWIVIVSVCLCCSLSRLSPALSVLVSTLSCSLLSDVSSSSSLPRNSWGSQSASGESNSVSRVSVRIRGVRLPREPALRRSRRSLEAPTASASAIAM